MISLEMTDREAEMLERALRTHLGEVEQELVHTDDRQLQRELAFDLRQLQALHERLRQRRAFVAAAAR
jgi:hypothetical protein